MDFTLIKIKIKSILFQISHRLNLFQDRSINQLDDKGKIPKAEIKNK